MFYKKIRKVTTALYIFSFLLIFKAYSQENELPKEVFIANNIPDSLKENANSVIRYSNVSFNIKGPGIARVKWHNIVTILNEKGDREAVLEMGYNRKFDTYSSIVMRAYDANGVVLKKYHKNDMYDGSAAGGSTLVTDERFLYVKHTVANYPTTIETEYEEDINSFIDFPPLEFQNLEQSVQKASIEVTIDPALGFRYKLSNIKIEPSKGKTQDGFDDFVWTIKNKKAIKKEDYVLPWKVIPKIEFAVNKFNCYGYPGDFSTWQSFGQWLQGLYADVSSLSPKREAEIKKMTDSIKSDKEKAKFLYSYLQKSTRYVSIQLGIGGYKPFSATFVDQKKYGDCKALANYMFALLKAVNIKAYPAIIRGEINSEPEDINFPYSSFNHEILCIPFKNDTTWLDCTMNYAEFGKIGPFTENRMSLIVTEDGGKFVNTPKSKMTDNKFIADANIILNAEGGSKAVLKIATTGWYREEFYEVSSFKVDEQKEYFLTRNNIKQPSEFILNPSNDNAGVRDLSINLEYDKFCDILAGDKQFIKPKLIDLCPSSVPINENRKTDYFFEHPLQKTCNTTIALPTGFEVETLPANQSLKFTYGSYDIKYVYDNVKNIVTSTAQFNIANHVIPAAKYTELQQFLDGVMKAQNKKLVIRKKA